MRFWDSSAIVPLVVEEPDSTSLKTLASAAEPMYVWWGTRLEVISALARRERLGKVPANGISASVRNLIELAHMWREVAPGEPLRNVAERLLRLHDLRAADSLQLAAAIMAGEAEPSSVDFVCLDARLRHAAAREGFRLLPEQPEE